MAFDPLNQLEEVNDVVARAGISDRRRRNEAIRMGMANQPALTSDFAPQINEVQQPSEFLGAGRQLARNQNVSDDIYNVFKPNLQRSGTETFYYGPDDYSTAQFGAQGYQTQNTQPGQYNILGGQGQVLGTGYKSLEDTVKDLYRKNFSYETYTSDKPIQLSDDTWYRIGNDNTPYATRQAAETALRSAYDNLTLNQLPFQQLDYYGNPIPLTDLQLWELLGQGLTGQSMGGNNAIQYNPEDPLSFNWRSIGGSAPTENLTGANVMYGSEPLIWDNKLLGYKMDMSPNEEGDYGYVNPNAMQIKDLHGKTQSVANLYRTVNNPDEWGKLVTKLSGDNYFVTPENVQSLPGFKNNYDYQFSQQEDDGFLGGFGDILGPLLSIGSFFFPALQIPSAMFSAMNALENDNPLGALLSVAGMDFGSGSLLGSAFGDMGFIGADAAQLAGQGISSSQISDILGQTYGGGLSTSLGETLGMLSGGTGIPLSALMAGGTGALTSALQGGNPLTSGFTSGLASLFGNQVSGATNSSGLGKAAQGAASWGLRNLFNKQGKTAGEDVIRQLPIILQATGNAAPQEQQRPTRPSTIQRPDVLSASQHRYLA